MISLANVRKRRVRYFARIAEQWRNVNSIVNETKVVSQACTLTQIEALHLRDSNGNLAFLSVDRRCRFDGK